MLALGVSVEGFSEYMTPLMSEVWPIIEAGLQDGDPIVRKATCVAVSCLCECLEEECVSKHAVLVPVSSFISELNYAHIEKSLGHNDPYQRSGNSTISVHRTGCPLGNPPRCH